MLMNLYLKYIKYCLQLLEFSQEEIKMSLKENISGPLQRLFSISNTTENIIMKLLTINISMLILKNQIV